MSDDPPITVTDAERRSPEATMRLTALSRMPRR